MRYLFVIAVTSWAILIAGCVPGTTDEVDFYDICARHNRHYSEPEAMILSFDEARSRSDYHFWRGDGHATVTVIVWAWSNGVLGDLKRASYNQRRCEFRKTGRGWRLI